MNTNETHTHSGFQPKTQTALNGSEQKQEQSSTPTQTSTSQRQTEADKAKAVADLFTGKTDTATELGSQDITDAASDLASSSGDDDASSVPAAGGLHADDAPGVGDAMTVKELATQLGTSPKKLYESLEIGLADGETITLSEMKNQFQRQEAVTREYAERDQQLSQREAQMLENLQLLQSVQSDLQGKLSPDVVQSLQERTQKQEASEQRLLFQAVPELRDSAKLDNFRTEISEAMSQFGFKPHELVIRDHRIALAMREFVRVKQQLNNLLSLDPERKQNPPKSHKPQRGNSKQAAKQRRAEQTKRARGGTETDKAAAVASLLKG